MAYTLPGSAYEMAMRGWHVFPLAPGSKVPARGSAGQDDATCDVETVLEWWARRPDSNIGVHCRPSGLYVVDLDVHSKDANGMDTWRELAATHGHVPTTTVRTAGGGYHLYYRAPDGVELKNTAGKLGPGVDTRGNGYVVAPPSRVGGNAYVPCAPRRPLAVLPQWVVDAIDPPRPAPTPPPAYRPSNNPDAVARRVHDLADEIARAPEGQGNHTAAQVAYMAGQYVGAGQITHEHALSILESGIAGWTWNKPRDRRTMIGTITRQLANGTASPRHWQ